MRPPRRGRRLVAADRHTIGKNRSHTGANLEHKLGRRGRREGAPPKGGGWTLESEAASAQSGKTASCPGVG